MERDRDGVSRAIADVASRAKTAALTREQFAALSQKLGYGIATDLVNVLEAVANNRIGSLTVDQARRALNGLKG